MKIINLANIFIWYFAQIYKKPELKIGKIIQIGDRKNNFLLSHFWQLVVYEYHALRWI